jgi:AbiV family abortive infection protein
LRARFSVSANAIALRDEAVILGDAGRLQRSVFLVQACLEEVLKAYLCLTRDPKSDEEWARFWKTFPDHRRKLAPLKEIEPDHPPEEHDAGNRALRTFRERTLDVDVKEDGDPKTPMGLVDPGELSRESVALWLAATNSALARELARLKDSEPSP